MPRAIFGEVSTSETSIKFLCYVRCKIGGCCKSPGAGIQLQGSTTVPD